MKTMNPADPLAELRDIHLPEPVSWWPPAPGWWLVALVSLAGLAGLIYFLRRWYLHNRYRKVALKKLSLLETHGTKPLILEEISAILRRVAIQAYGRERVASLAGDAWLDFLDETGRTSAFSSGAGRVLGADLYRPSVEVDIPQVELIAANWIKGHRPC